MAILREDVAIHVGGVEDCPRLLLLTFLPCLLVRCPGHFWDLPLDEWEEPMLSN